MAALTLPLFYVTVYVWRMLFHINYITYAVLDAVLKLTGDL